MKRSLSKRVLPVVQLAVAAAQRHQLARACRAPRSRRAPAPGSGRRCGWWTAGARSRSVVRPCAQPAQRLLDQRLALAVQAEVASSRIRMRGSARSARAMAMRCRWPPESLIPALADDRVVALREAAHELVARGRCAPPPRSRRAWRPGARSGCCRPPCRRTGSSPAAPRRAARGSRPAAARPGRGRRPGPCRWVGRLKAITRLTSVLLPEPLRAHQRRGGARRRVHGHVLAAPAAPRCTRTTRRPAARRRAMRPQRSRLARPPGPRCASPAISRMRSSPANASLICVPMQAICITGAASRPVKTR